MWQQQHQLNPSLLFTLKRTFPPRVRATPPSCLLVRKHTRSSLAGVFINNLNQRLEVAGARRIAAESAAAFRTVARLHQGCGFHPCLQTCTSRCVCVCVFSRLVSVCLRLRFLNRVQAGKIVSERNLRGRKTWKQPRTDWLGTSTQPSLPAQLESPREFQQTRLASSANTHSRVETTRKNLQI